MYAGVCGLAWVWAGVHGYALGCACVLDEFSEFLPENRVPTSADFNTYPFTNFSSTYGPDHMFLLWQKIKCLTRRILGKKLLPWHFSFFQQFFNIN